MASPMDFVIRHTDGCVRCSVCDWCPIGKALFDAAIEVCKQMFEPPPLPPLPSLPDDDEPPALPPIPRLN